MVIWLVGIIQRENAKEKRKKKKNDKHKSLLLLK